MIDAPLKVVALMRPKSAFMEDPSENFKAVGTTVHPRRTPVKPATLLKEQISIAHSSAPAHRKLQDFPSDSAVISAGEKLDLLHFAICSEQDGDLFIK